MKVIILNGSAGVGKTTIARRLCELHQDSICIHGDSIKEFVVNRNNSEIEKQLTYKIGATLIKRYIDAGYKFIVFEFVFENSSHIELVRQLLGDIELKNFTLWDELSNIIRKEKNRRNRLPLRDRVTECYRIFERNIKEMDAVLIDNSKDIYTTVSLIEEKL